MNVARVLFAGMAIASLAACGGVAQDAPVASAQAAEPAATPAKHEANPRCRGVRGQGAEAVLVRYGKGKSLEAATGGSRSWGVEVEVINCAKTPVEGVGLHIAAYLPRSLQTLAMHTTAVWLKEPLGLGESERVTVEVPDVEEGKNPLVDTRVVVGEVLKKPVIDKPEGFVPVDREKVVMAVSGGKTVVPAKPRAENGKER